MTDEQTVIISKQRSEREVYHSDADCKNLRDKNREVSLTIAERMGLRECITCQGVFEGARDQDHSIYQAAMEWEGADD